jgi:hypothetical protein
MRQFKVVMLGLLGTVLALASVFFAFYTARLLYVNLTITGDASRRQSGMYIGAIAFPLAAVLFGWLSWRCIKVARRLSRKSMMDTKN